MSFIRKLNGWLRAQKRKISYEIRHRNIEKMPLKAGGQKPRILYFTVAYPTFSESYMHDEIDALRDEFDIRIIALKKTARPRKRAFEFTLINYSAPCLVYAPFEKVNLAFSDTNQVDALKEISQVIEEFKPDYLHAHYLGMGVLAAELSNRHNIPFTVRTHSMDVLNEPAEKLAAYSFFLNSATQCRRVLAFNHSVERLSCAGLKENLLHPCWPVLKHSAFDKVGVQRANTKVLCCGPAVKKKRHRDVVDLGKLLPSHEVHLYAEGPTLLDTREYNMAQGQPIQIKYSDPEHMPTVYAGYDWLVYPSDTELNKVGLPLGVAEAMAAGLGVCWQRLPGRESEQLEFLGGAGFLFDSIAEVPELLATPYSEEKRNAGFAAARRYDIQKHKHLLADIWSENG